MVSIQQCSTADAGRLMNQTAFEVDQSLVSEANLHRCEREGMRHSKSQQDRYNETPNDVKSMMIKIGCKA